MLGGARHELLERQTELRAIETSFAAAASDTGSLVLVEGPAGIGKTVLLGHAAQRAELRGVSLLRARAGQREAGFPFAVIRQLFEPALAALDDRQRTDVFRGAAGLCAGLFDDRDPTAALHVDADFSVLHGLYWLTANLADLAPHAVIIDDVQWADPPSLRWVDYMARRLDGIGVAVILARRPGEVAAADELLADLARTSETIALRPAALSPNATAELVKTAFGGEATEEFCRACYSATGGNPLLVRQLTLELAREGILATDYAVDRVTETMASAVAELVVKRLRTGGEDARALARAVVVLGERSDPALAAELAGLDRDTGGLAADMLRALDILEAGTTLDFAHPLVGSAVAEQFGPDELAAMHKQAARILSAHGRPVDVVAPHAAAGPPEGDAWVAETLAAGAERAAASGAPDSAIAMLRRALAEPPPSETVKIDLLADLGTLVSHHDMQAAVPILTEARDRSSDPRRRAAVAQTLALPLLACLRTGDAVAQLDAARDALDEDDRELRDELEAAALATSRWDLAFAEDHAARMARGRRLAGRDTGAGRLALFLAGMNDVLAGALSTGREAIARSLDAGLMHDVGVHGPPFGLACVTLVLGGDVETPARHLAAAAVVAQQTGSAFAQSNLCNARARVAITRGALADAEADATMGLEVAEVSMGMPTLVASLIEALVERGELDRAAETLNRYGAGGELPPLISCLLLVEARARLRAARGDHPGALEDLETTAEWLRLLGSDGTVVPWRALTADSLLAMGDRTQALAYATQGADVAVRFGEPRGLSIALRTLGTVIGGTEGLRHVDDALAASERSASTLERARAHTVRGELLIGLDRAADGREALRQGLHLAVGCGATPLAARAHAALVAAGARPRRPAITGAAALTSGELRVARLAAGGLSNREVAEQLFLTVKTVETHLSATYRKLSIGSRAELGGALDTPELPAAPGAAAP